MRRCSLAVISVCLFLTLASAAFAQPGLYDPSRLAPRHRLPAPVQQLTLLAPVAAEGTPYSYASGQHGHAAPGPATGAWAEYGVPEDGHPNYGYPGYGDGAWCGNCYGGGRGAPADSCHAHDVPTCETRCGFFATVGGLVMSRDDGNPYRFSYFDTAEEFQLSNTHDAAMEYSGGVEARFGYYFCCGAYALEAVYWGIYPDSQQSTLLGTAAPGNLNGILNWSGLDYNGNDGDWWVNNAAAHRVAREFEFHNVEINLIGFSSGCPNDRLDLAWFSGVRFFRFTELLQFAADNTDTAFTGAANELYYNINVKNNLVGWQLAGRGRFRLTDSLALTSSLAGGIFGNHISHHSSIGGAAGYATVNNGPFSGRGFDIRSSKNDVALLMQLDLGLSWALTCRWQVGLGYRALGVAGVALPSNQIYPDLRGLNDVAEIDSNGSLILHGGYANVQFNY